jgi:SAM-dependent methyltransferase
MREEGGGPDGSFSRGKLESPPRIDYDEASKTYDHTRSPSDGIVELLDRGFRFSPSTIVLDFGCGTGNYLRIIHANYRSICCGVEPSEGMRKIARGKDGALDIRAGDHRNIPFANGTFDAIFMTDVIHHVDDMDTLFRQLRLKLKRGGKLCVVTESHVQIGNRWYNPYFPSLIENERKRYPDIGDMDDSALRAGLLTLFRDIRPSDPEVVVGAEFVKMVEEKNYSMFRLISDEEFGTGLARLRADIGKTIRCPYHSETLAWYLKG